MRRREFLGVLSGAAAAWPAIVTAQQPAMPVVGFLSGGLSQDLNATAIEHFRKGLNDVGYIDGQNVAIELRATARNDTLPALAAELVHRRVDVIFATGNANSAQAAKAATSSIPIVFANGSDPVAIGLVASMNRPGGNLTGVSYYTGALGAKRLELLREIIPRINNIGFLINPTNLISKSSLPDMLAAAAAIDQRVVVLNANTPNDIDQAIASVPQRGIGAMVVDVDSFFVGRHKQIVGLAAHYRIPASYANRVFVAAGGLMSYADNRFESRRQAGVYAGRILKGEKPANLPVLQPTKFELVINLKTAKVLGLTVPPTLLALADEVIE